MCSPSLKNLILQNLIRDLRLIKSRIDDQSKNTVLKIYDDYLEYNNAKIEYEIDTEFYQLLIDMLIEFHPHYANVIGDMVYNSLNERTTNETAIDVVQTYCTVVKKWIASTGNLQLIGYQLMADGYKGVIFETGGQWLAAIRFNKNPWEFFASRQHTSKVSLLPYFCDLFNTGKVEASRPVRPLAEILDKCLPDWYPLLSSS